ncbi:hypothetical protein HBB16_20980 [Pseudonocardia sp. MCCB 268]|nr:hypothetical protein [Pseudonocardia cytotoxica]
MAEGNPGPRRPARPTGPGTRSPDAPPAGGRSSPGRARRRRCPLPSGQRRCPACWPPRHRPVLPRPAPHRRRDRRRPGPGRWRRRDRGRRGNAAEELCCRASRTPASVFLTVLDVHVQWAPVNGRVAAVGYRTGSSCRPTSTARPARTTERNGGSPSSARRRPSVSSRSPGAAGAPDRVLAGGRVTRFAAGERFGLIRPGSRVDTYLPPGPSRLVRSRPAHARAETVLGVVLGVDGDPQPRAGWGTELWGSAVRRTGYLAGVRLLPNAVTVLNLCAGLSAVYLALQNRFDLAIGPCSRPRSP